MGALKFKDERDGGLHSLRYSCEPDPW